MWLFFVVESFYNKNNNASAQKLKPIATILIADDNADVLLALAATLAPEKSLRVLDVAHNGEELLSKANKLTPDLCIIDYEMPGINGLAASEMLLKKDKNMKIIILTMHNEKSLIRRIKAMGINGFLIKGCENSELLSAIKLVLEGETYFT